MICNLFNGVWIIHNLLGFLEETVEDAGDWSEQFAVGLGALSDAKNSLERINLACYVLAVGNRQRLRGHATPQRCTVVYTCVTYTTKGKLSDSVIYIDLYSLATTLYNLGSCT